MSTFTVYQISVVICSGSVRSSEKVSLLGEVCQWALNVLMTHSFVLRSRLFVWFAIPADCG